jgi:adenylate cyclase
MTITIRKLKTVAARTARATVMFVDLRGYTGLAEFLPPLQVITLLDEFFAVLISVTEACGGEIFHMAGDAMMAGFGIHEQNTAGASAALAAGRGILSRFTPLSNRWQSELDIQAGIGIGLHLGEVAVGNLGPPGRQTATLVGDTVNIAARLCARARAGEVLFSAAVADSLSAHGVPHELANGPAPFLQLPRFGLRGRTTPLDIWCVPARERLNVVIQPS